jgi:6-phosphofructo-2-kinase/fructose-2,6-biphosphatase
LKKILSTPVNFRDVTLRPNESEPLEEGDGEGHDEEVASPDSSSLAAIAQLVKTVSRTKQVIIMVGLPARGKTFLSNKIKAYLTWLGHETGHFNVGNFRRQEGDPKTQDASFFAKDNAAGLEARHRALLAALDEMMRWLNTGTGQVAIFDATNTTKQRRQLLREILHGRCEYLCLETICNDPETLDRNYRNKLTYSPDYKDVDEEKALQDFKERINKYEEVYEPLDDRSFHYIKLIDHTTGRGYLDINRISGYIPGKLVFYLMQV